MKKFLIVYYGDAPECVEGFDKDAKRSCKGALHVSPGRKLTVTECELKHIKKHYSHMDAKLRVLGEKKEAEPKKEEAKSEPKKEKEAPKEAESSSHEEGKKKKKKKK